MKKENLIVSERAHLMCPNMFFGIIIKINKIFTAQKFEEGLSVLAKAHPLLSSYVCMDDMEHLCFVNRKKYQVPYQTEENRTWEQIFSAISKKGWDVRFESLLKVYVFPGETQFEILFVVHHILCDGRGLLQLAEEFADFYVNGTRPIYVQEQLIEKQGDLPVGSELPFISKYLVKDVNRHWRKEKQIVPYDTYLKFEREFAQKNSVSRCMISYLESDLEEIINVCKINKISVNDYLVAKMMKEEHANKVIIAADIRERLKCYKPGSLGNYATAYSINIKKTETKLLHIAEQVHEKVKKIKENPSHEMLVLSCYFQMEPTLIDAVAISALGNFDSKAGKFAGDKMFGYALRDGYSITNLGKIESNCIAEGFFIPPASPATKKTWGVLTVNGNMRIVEASYLPR